MAKREWLLDGPPGETAVKATIVAEDATTADVVGVNGGTVSIKFSSLHVQSGTSLEFVNGAASNGVVRLAHVAADKQGALRFYHWAPTAPTSTVVMWSFRHASGQLFRLGVTYAGHTFVQTSAGVVISESDTAVTFGQLNRFEVVYTVATASTGSLTVRVFNGESASPYLTHTVTGADLGAADCSHVEFGTPNTTPNPWTQYFDSVATNNGATTEIGARGTVASLPAPVLQIVTFNPTIQGGSDGSIAVAWEAVPGAALYESCILTGNVTSGAVSTRSSAVLNRQFPGLAAGTYTIAVRALTA